MNKKTPNVVVIGSMNMDLVVKASRFPNSGETIMGSSFTQTTGGKGANQAVAAARLGAAVTMIGSVGQDIYGEKLKQSLKAENVNIDNVQTVNGTASGTALITLTDEDNSIIVVPGANRFCLPKDIIKHEQLIKNADIVLIQLEIPIETVKTAVDLAYKNNTPVILNPAPARELPTDLLAKVTYLVPNETEIEYLCKNPRLPEHNIESLLRAGLRNIILTRGKEGVIYNNDQERKLYYQSSFNVRAEDTTGAGDGFNSGLAVAIAEGKSLHEAVAFGVAVGALTVTKKGAQEAMPYREEVEQILQKVLLKEQ